MAGKGQRRRKSDEHGAAWLQAGQLMRVFSHAADVITHLHYSQQHQIHRPLEDGHRRSVWYSLRAPLSRAGVFSQREEARDSLFNGSNGRAQRTEDSRQPRGLKVSVLFTLVQCAFAFSHATNT